MLYYGGALWDESAMGLAYLDRSASRYHAEYPSAVHAIQATLVGETAPRRELVAVTPAEAVASPPNPDDALRPI